MVVWVVVAGAVAPQEGETMTPMFSQYLRIKADHPHALLFFRMGDFYEMFFDDAQTASAELGIALTSRDVSKKEGKKAPMCGVPHHSAETYIARLVKKGYSVAIAEQTEPPTPGKTLVNRAVTRVVTPGTITDEHQLNTGEHNWVMAIFADKLGMGVAYSDLTTGDFLVRYFPQGDDRLLLDEIARVSPAEVIVNDYFGMAQELLTIFDLRPRVFVAQSFAYEQAGVTVANQFEGLEVKALDKHSVCAAGALLDYLFSTQFTQLSHLRKLQVAGQQRTMMLDMSSRANLELIKTQRTGDKKGSLLWVLDKTKTPMGARKLRSWVQEPLADVAAINTRLSAVEALVNNPIQVDELQSNLSHIKDMERILSKVVVGRSTPADLLNLKQTLQQLPALAAQLTTSTTPMLVKIAQLDQLTDLQTLIDTTLSEQEGEIISTGVNADLDSYREAKTKGTQWLLELEEKERAATGIKNLKIKYARVFGYCIEISTAASSQAPERYIRRQTLTNAERYTTPELKAIEDKILSADDHIKTTEARLLKEVCDHLAAQTKRVSETAERIAALDSLVSLAHVALRNNYVKPTVTDSDQLTIENGRHPVVEHLTTSFVPNSVNLTPTETIHVITGPNMAGKSTYMRGVSLIALMAQMGSFVPADRVVMGVLDRIFTRIGASDDLATGQSTFMVEMNEVAHILNNATHQSLVILDEIGRGTSTHDGLCIAWSILEHMAETIGAKTLFATHYHELAQIEGRMASVANYCLPVEEIDGELIFLRKVARGAVDKSYGIQVAKLSGIPTQVIARAEAIMKKVEHVDLVRGQYKTKGKAGQADSTQISIFGDL